MFFLFIISFLFSVFHVTGDGDGGTGVQVPSADGLHVPSGASTNAMPVTDAGDGVHVSSGASTHAVAEDEGACDALS